MSALKRVIIHCVNLPVKKYLVVKSPFHRQRNQSSF